MMRPAGSSSDRDSEHHDPTRSPLAALAALSPSCFRLNRVAHWHSMPVMAHAAGGVLTVTHWHWHKLERGTRRCPAAVGRPCQCAQGRAATAAALASGWRPPRPKVGPSRYLCSGCSSASESITPDPQQTGGAGGRSGSLPRLYPEHVPKLPRGPPYARPRQQPRKRRPPPAAHGPRDPGSGTGWQWVDRNGPDEGRARLRVDPVLGCGTGLLRQRHGLADPATPALRPGRITTKFAGSAVRGAASAAAFPQAGAVRQELKRLQEEGRPSGGGGGRAQRWR